MLGSVSTIQPVVHGGFTPQQAISTEKANESQHKDNNLPQAESSVQSTGAEKELSKQDLATIQQLKKRDIEVKAHEQAHLIAAGSYATGGASYTYTTGPNGVRYATAGEVGIDTSKIEGDPEATLQKADAIRRAALAPASPSSQDQKVANQAASLAETARTELIQLKQQAEESKVQEQKISSSETDEEKNEVKTISTIETNNNKAYQPIIDTGTVINFAV